MDRSGLKALSSTYTYQNQVSQRLWLRLKTSWTLGSKETMADVLPVFEALTEAERFGLGVAMSLTRLALGDICPLQFLFAENMGAAVDDPTVPPPGTGLFHCPSTWGLSCHQTPLACDMAGDWN